MTNKYPSKYSNGKSVTAAQFITEIICERIAQKEKKDLHYRFWLSENWEKQYKSQIGTANKLLKIYEPKDIIDSLLSKEGYKIYSLRAPHLSEIIEKTIKNRPQHTTTITTVERNFLQEGKSNITKRNILDKLKDLDNDSYSR